VPKRWLPLPFLLALVPLALADGPGDNLPDKVRPVPPPGVPIADADRQELQSGAEALGKEIEELRKILKQVDDTAPGKGSKEVEELRKRLPVKPALDLLPDVQVYYNAVRYALEYDEFYDPKEVDVARKHLEAGSRRARALQAGQAPWTTQTGLVVRGYVSKIDGSVQPYGLVVPASYGPNVPHRFRLDVWCHGRGEKLTELAFVDQRQKSPGEFTPPHAFVLHLYGRYCCANKFAGEIDCLEALEAVEKAYPIDPNRRVIRGFSMGGAACWQFAVHYPSLWAAAAPGAGFSETADFLKVFQKEQVEPAWYERKLWHMYDCTDYAGNLFNLPTVAYSGEKDTQKQAADMMAVAMKKEGLTLTHLIGPGTGHSYHPETKKELNRRIDAIVALGRNPVPDRVKFTTYTLRYNRSFWVVVEGLDSHWEKGSVDATLFEGTGVGIDTRGVSALTLRFGPGECLLEATAAPKVTLDGTELKGPPVRSDRSWVAHFRKHEGKWQAVESLEINTLRKMPGLQGPIDDAFMGSFLIVKPTGKPAGEKTGAWVDAEMKRAVSHWRKQFRGEPPVKDDRDVTGADIAEHNLILWGDPSSNKVLAKIADKLPVRWEGDKVIAGDKSYAAGEHMPVLIYPNPLNVTKYVVLNSGFTFRDYDYLNNARQVPKLPDWAVIDVKTAPNARYPGQVVDAGFFDERWQFRPAK
jgi:hypothetical protein